MSNVINIYCDESCHLEHDGQTVMVLGAVWCPRSKSREVAERLREIKVRHGLDKHFEMKWVKASPAKQGFYLDCLDYFFDDDDLHFRAVVVPDKSQLCHESYGQDHDTWYYKMYFVLLKELLDPTMRYHIYLDVKDTRGAQKVSKLHDVLCHNIYDFDRSIIERLQQVRSHEVEAVQLADLLTGAVGYVHRGLETSKAKLSVIARIRARSGHDLSRTTLPREGKLNLLVWHARERS